MFLYRVTMRKLTTRAQIARQQLEAIRPVDLEKEGPHQSPDMLADLATERGDVVLHVATDSPYLTWVEEAVECEVGMLDSIEGFITTVELLGDCIIWRKGVGMRPADQNDPPVEG